MTTMMTGDSPSPSRPPPPPTSSSSSSHSHASPFLLVAQHGREHRHDQTVQIRKKDRDARIANERQQKNLAPAAALELSEDDELFLRKHGVPQLMDDFVNQNRNVLRTTMAVRKLLVESSSPTRRNDGVDVFESIARLGILNHVVVLLDRADSPRLQFEAIWSLTCAAFMHAEEVVRSGAIPKIVSLLNSPHVMVVEQALWSLGNIMSKSTTCRDECVRLGAAQFVRILLVRVHAMSSAEYEHLANASRAEDSMHAYMTGLSPVPISRQAFIRHTTWAMSGMVRGGGNSDLVVREIELCLSYLCDLLNTSDDPGTVSNILWLLADFARSRARLVLEQGISTRVLELGMFPHQIVQIAATQFLCNMMEMDPQAQNAFFGVRRAEQVLFAQLRSTRRDVWAGASLGLLLACTRLSLSGLGNSVVSRFIPECEILFTRCQDSQVPLDVKTNCFRILSILLQHDQQETQAILTHDFFLLLARSLDEGVEKDIVFLSAVVRCAVFALRRGGSMARRIFEENGGVVNLRRMEFHSSLATRSTSASRELVLIEQMVLYILQSMFPSDDDHIDFGGIGEQLLLTSSHIPTVPLEIAQSIRTPGQVEFQSFFSDT